MLAHGLLYVGRGNLDFIQEQIEQNKPDSWKGYNISNAAKIDNDPMSPMRQWRHDDEEVAYPDVRIDRESVSNTAGTETGLQQHLRPQGAVYRPTGKARDRSSRRPAQGGEGLAEPQLHHVSLVHPAAVLHVRRTAGGQGREAAERRARHQLDDRVRHPRRAVQELLRGNRHDLGIIDRDVPDTGRAHHGTADEVHGAGPHRVRFRFGVVRVPAVADRRAVAVPDPRGHAEEVRVPGTHPGREDEKSWASIQRSCTGSTRRAICRRGSKRCRPTTRSACRRS